MFCITADNCRRFSLAEILIMARIERGPDTSSLSRPRPERRGKGWLLRTHRTRKLLRL